MCAVGDLHRVHNFTQHNVLTAARERSRGLPHLANTDALRTDRATRSQRFMHTQVTAVAHGASHTRVLCLQKSTVRKLTKVSYKDPGVRTCATKQERRRRPSSQTENRVVHSAKHKHSRVCLSHAAVTHNCVNSLNILPRPQSCSKDIEDGLRGWQMGSSPKAPT